MASKLYPPILDASIPVFNKTTIQIPFKHNPLVSPSDYNGMVVQVKDINGKIIQGSPFEASLISNTDGINMLTCLIPSENLLETGNWYKFQIAYKSNTGIVGYYSTAAVGKYLNTKLEVKLEFASGLNLYKGTYSHDDPSEKPYTYQFILRDSASNIIEDTGKIIHNVSEDKSETESEDTFYFSYYTDEYNSKYSLEYKVITINGKELSAEMTITKNLLDGMEHERLFAIKANVNKEEGSVELWAISNKTPLTGHFVVRKTCSKDGFLYIQDITSFNLIRQDMADKDNHPIPIKLCEDLTCEAGYYYKYFIQRYNQHHIYTTIIGESDKIFVSFDHSFLYDGEKQLKILYNPKVSSFKTNIQQNKVDTIGSKYPFITRNAVVNYKEFPISGLISFLSDTNYKFMPIKDQIRLGIIADNVYREKTNSAGSSRTEIGQPQARYFRKGLQRGNERNLVDININGEKEFKLMVLDFLNSDKPKLFRSATEGNYCVYTMNSSLTPNDTLGRMLHTFNCTAYEIKSVKDFYDSLIGKDFQMLSQSLAENKLDEKFSRSISFFKDDYLAKFNFLREGEYATNFYIRDADPGSEFTISLIDKGTVHGDWRQKSGIGKKYEYIVIGATGSYNYFIAEGGKYINGIWAGHREREADGNITKDKNKIYNMPNYAVINIRHFAKVPISDFDFLQNYDEKEVIALQSSNENYRTHKNWCRKTTNEVKTYEQSITENFKTNKKAIVDYYKKIEQRFFDFRNNFSRYFLDNEKWANFIYDENLRWHNKWEDFMYEFKALLNLIHMICFNKSSFELWKIQNKQSESQDFEVLKNALDNVDNHPLFKIDITSDDPDVKEYNDFIQGYLQQNFSTIYNMVLEEGLKKIPLNFNNKEKDYVLLIDPTFDLRDNNSYKIITNLDKVILIQARNFNTQYPEKVIYGFSNYLTVIEEMEKLNIIYKALKSKQAAEEQEEPIEIFISQALYDFLRQFNFLDSTNSYTSHNGMLTLEKRIAYNQRGDFFDSTYAELYNDKELKRPRYDLKYSIFMYNNFGNKENKDSPMGKAAEAQKQVIQTVLIPPGGTALLQANGYMPKNFFYYKTTGDNIHFDISYSVSDRVYQFPDL